VRSLAHDLGAILGCGAVLAGLRRTRAGAFTLAQAVDASWLSGDRRGDLVDRLVPLDALLPDVPSIGLTRQDVERVAHGQDVAGAVAPLVRMVDERGHLVALATPGRRPGLLHPSVVLR
jgi:tRNA pseudouridine55 synthase